MLKSETKKAKWNILICFFAILLLMIIGVAIFYHNNNFSQNISPTITVRGIQEATETQDNYILAKIEEKYYGISPSKEFSQLFLFEKWKNIKEINKGLDVVISIRFAELFVIDIYKNGLIAAYDGYAAKEYSSVAYYEMPISTVESIKKFFEENANRHKFGDGTIGFSTFAHN